MTVKLGLLALLEAKPGKGDELGAFLEAGRELAAAEDGTVTCTPSRSPPRRTSIFDTFETEEARQAHLNGAIPEALGKSPATSWPSTRHPPAGRAGGE